MRANRLGLSVSWPVISAVLLFLGTSPSAFAAAPQVTSFSPASGTIGAKVTIAGSGFTGATDVRFNGAPAAGFTVNSATKITATAPAAISTGVISVKTSGGTGKSLKNFTATVGSQVSQSVGHPLTALTVAGAGFHPSKPVDIYFDTTDSVLAVSTSKGLVSVPLTVPESTQPGKHWVTLVERGTNLSTQAAFTVQTDWSMTGFDSQSRGSNPYENTVGASNVGKLTDYWGRYISATSNPSPAVVAGGNAFVIESTGKITALSSTGKVLWTATTGSETGTLTPAAYNGLVYFGSDDGNVYAFKTNCRSDGGVCTPTWKKSVGTAVTASLTVYKGKLYAPSSDGKIHVLNSTTGAAGRPIFGANATSGPVTTAVVFTADGSFYYGTGTILQYRTGRGATSSFDFGVHIVTPAAYSGDVLVPAGDGQIHSFYLGWTATVGSGFVPPPVLANNIVYAGGNTTIGAYEAGKGTPIWTIASGGPVSGLAAANGVLYVCVGNQLVAYNAQNGDRLWTGGGCGSARPEIVNGTLYIPYILFSTYTLPGLGADRVVAHPSPAALRPNYRLLKQPYREGAEQAADD